MAAGMVLPFCSLGLCAADALALRVYSLIEFGPASVRISSQTPLLF